MINRGGENIYPREIEIAIESHPDVNAVAVIGIPDEGLGERVKAVIEPFESKTLTHEIITEYLKDKLDPAIPFWWKSHRKREIFPGNLLPFCALYSRFSEPRPGSPWATHQKTGRIKP